MQATTTVTGIRSKRVLFFSTIVREFCCRVVCVFQRDFFFLREWVFFNEKDILHIFIEMYKKSK